MNYKNSVNLPQPFCPASDCQLTPSSYEQYYWEEKKLFLVEQLTTIFFYFYLEYIKLSWKHFACFRRRNEQDWRRQLRRLIVMSFVSVTDLTQNVGTHLCVTHFASVHTCVRTYASCIHFMCIGKRARADALRQFSVYCLFLQKFNF